MGNCNDTVGRLRRLGAIGRNLKIALDFVQFETTYKGGWGTLLVALLVEAQRYKPEGRGFESRWCHWNSLFI